MENNPLHLVRCAKELLGMYIAEQVIKLEDFMDDALDVYGNDE